MLPKKRLAARLPAGVIAGMNGIQRFILAPFQEDHQAFPAAETLAAGDVQAVAGVSAGFVGSGGEGDGGHAHGLPHCLGMGQAAAQGLDLEILGVLGLPRQPGEFLRGGFTDQEPDEF